MTLCLASVASLVLVNAMRLPIATGPLGRLLWAHDSLKRRHYRAAGRVGLLQGEALGRQVMRAAVTRTALIRAGKIVG